MMYEGKSKRVYVKNSNTLIMEFKDTVTALDGARIAEAPGKGILNAALTAYFFDMLKKEGIENHFMDYDGCRVITVKKLNMVPIEVIVRNYAYGSLIKRLPLFKPLTKLTTPLVEFHYKSDELHDPLILPEDVVNSGLMSLDEVKYVILTSLRVNEVLTRRLSECGLRLIDFKLEYGRDLNNKLVLADEISGDTIRVLDSDGRHLDKELFRRGGGVDDLIKAYALLAQRLGVNVTV